MGGRSSSFGKKAGGGAKLDLPELEGSEKQIKWAKDIRQKIIDRVNQFEKDGKVGDIDGGWDQFSDQQRLSRFARYTNMGHNAPDDVDFFQFKPGGVFKGWMKDDLEDFKNFPLSKNEAAVERPAVKNYYNSVMSTYNRYAPKGKYPGKTASREVRNRYENQEKQAYRKTLATMVRKGLNKETRAAEYIDRYRYNWDE